MALELNQVKQLENRSRGVQVAFDLHSTLLFRSDSVDLVMDLLAYSVPLESPASIVAWCKNSLTKSDVLFKTGLELKRSENYEATTLYSPIG